MRSIQVGFAMAACVDAECANSRFQRRFFMARDNETGFGLVDRSRKLLADQ